MKNYISLLMVLFISLNWTIAQRTIVKSGSEKAFLGIESDYLSKEKAKILGFDNYYGSYVSRVLGNTAAERANLKPFDYVIGVDDHRTNKDQRLTSILRKYSPGNKAQVHFIRQGQAKSASVTFGTSSEADRSKDYDNGKPFLGINDRSDNESEKIGVKVNVVNNSTAESIGLENGDKILTINGHKMVDWDDITTALGAMQVGQTIELTYERNGKTLQGNAPIKSHSDTYVYRKAPSVNRSTGRAFLGIYSNTMSDEKAEKLGFDNRYGSYVSQVIPNSAAEKAGVEAFDYIYGIDEYRVGQNQSLTGILSKYKPGDKATVHLVRKGNRTTLPITLGTRSNASGSNKSQCEEAFLGIRNSRAAGSDEGIRVDIVSNSTASALGLEDKDIITHINGNKIIDWEDISTAIDNMTVGDPITVRFIRNGQNMENTENIKSRCDTKKIVERNTPKFEFKYLEDDEDEDEDEDESEISDLDLSNIKVSLRQVSSSEANDMKRLHNVELPINNNLEVDELKLHPNTNQGLYRLQFDLPSQGLTSVKIYNAAGRLIYNYDLGRFSGQFSDQVDISQNGTGKYFLSIRQDEKFYSKKIILEKS